MAKTMIIFVALLVISARSFAAFDCPAARQQLFPCAMFLINLSPAPGPQCCGGVKAVAGAASLSKENLQSACECLKSAVGSYPGVNYGNARNLPSLCHVQLNVTIDPNVDCTRL